MSLKQKTRVSRGAPVSKKTNKGKKKKRKKKRKKSMKEIRKHMRELNTYWASPEEQINFGEYKKQESHKKEKSKK